MLDRIVIASQHQAYMVYDDGRIVSLTSDVDVRRMIYIMLEPIECSDNVSPYQSESLEDTQVTEITKIA